MSAGLFDDLLGGLDETDPVALVDEEDDGAKIAAGAAAMRDRAEVAEELRQQTSAVRFSKRQFGARRALTAGQKEQAAAVFGAEGGSVSAGKRLLDTRAPQYKTVTKTINAARAYWEAVTYPYPEDGLRLLPTARVEEFDSRMQEYRRELEAACEELQKHYEELREKARESLGSLFNPADYPDDIRGQFAIGWEFPSVEPPNYLRDMHPELYQQQVDRINRRFERTVDLFEEVVSEELANMLDHLVERLESKPGEKKKVFRDSAVENLQEFFGRFRQLNINSNQQLEQLVGQAEKVIGDRQPEELRKSDALRDQVREQLGQVKHRVDSMIVERPKRAVRFED